MINHDLWKSLEKIGSEDLTIKAYLLNLEDTTKRFEFMFYPGSVSISGANTLKESYAMFGRGNLKYESSQLVRVDVNDLMFTVPRHNRSMIPIEKDLDLLRYPAKGKIQTPSLAFVYGKRSIQPLQLESYKIDEIAHLNGVPTDLLVSISFIAQDVIKL